MKRQVIYTQADNGENPTHHMFTNLNLYRAYALLKLASLYSYPVILEIN